jgi:hypothetical protein
MNDIHLEQAIWVGTKGRYRLMGRSPGFQDEWLSDAEELCVAFGDRPPGVDCPPCVFAQPFGRRFVVVVQVADQNEKSEIRNPKSETKDSEPENRNSKSENHNSKSENSERSSDTGSRSLDLPLGFRQLIIARRDYPLLEGDPFALAERLPPSWGQRGDLPALSVPPATRPRTVEDVQQVLKTPDGPALLGGVQALLDGGRLVFQRPVPDTQLLRNLWTLLPLSNRCELWPASFSFGNTLRFDAVVTSRPNNEGYDGYLTEDQDADYPQGRYELSLQTAAEAGDQAELDSLFRRRSRAQTWRLGWILLGFMVVLLVVMRLVNSMVHH